MTGEAETNTIEETPANTVVKSWSGLDSGQVLLYDPESAEPDIADSRVCWDAIHDGWAGRIAESGTDHFDYIVKIHDMDGEVVRQITIRGPSPDRSYEFRQTSAAEQKPRPYGAAGHMPHHLGVGRAAPRGDNCFGTARW